MEIYGDFIEEDRVYVEEIRKRKDFNNIHLNFRDSSGMSYYEKMALDLKSIIKEDGELFERTNQGCNKTKSLREAIDLSETVLGVDLNNLIKRRREFKRCEGPEFEQLSRDIVPLYIYLRKEGFSQEDICS